MHAANSHTVLCMVVVENLTKKYGAFTALDSISFTVKKGEIIGLLGPNGAGKTTTMRIITCFMPSTAGKVSVAGFDVFTQSNQVRKRLGYMPENVPLYPELRVTEYLAYRGKLKGLRGRTLAMRMEKVLENCGLTTQKKRLIGHLSKGNRQRVGLAEALLSDPELLILDEPTIGLDPHQVRNVRDLIRDIGHDRTVILSTHILPEVEMVCERVIIMHQGRIARETTMAELKDPAHARYICEVKADAQKLTKALASLGADDVVLTHNDGWTHATCRATDPQNDLRPAIAACVNKNAWPLRRLDMSSPTLEDMFVSITAK